jgi:uncharacterized membrane protein
MLREQVYSGKQDWQKFLRLFFISLGVGFTAAGILFFFAYNWADLHKFAKIGLIEALVVISTLVVIFSKVTLDIKNILLTGASILVGVLFAVFGQIYQTGANAYDFFLGWTMAITIWVLIANYAPLWTVFILLINTTLYFYAEQVAQHWPLFQLNTLLFLINIGFLIAAIVVSHIKPEHKSPGWFTNLLALATATIATVGISYGIMERSDDYFIVLALLTVLVYAAGIAYSLKFKKLFFLSIIPFSVIIIICSLMLEQNNDSGMFLLVSLFVLGSVTLTIKLILSLQKQWTK